MKSKRAQRRFPRVAAVVLASALQFGIYPLSGAGLKTLYFSSIGAARFDGGAFRTVFHFTNEASDVRAGRLQFSSVAGGSLNATLAQTWSGTRGTLETSAGLAVFTLPGKSALELIVALPA